MQIFLAWKIGRFIEVQLARGSSKILFTGSLDEDLGGYELVISPAEFLNYSAIL